MSTRTVIHIVDDDAAFRKSVTRLLKLSGYETASYETGRELLDHIDKSSAGCVLLDLDMPMNGLQIQAAMKELGVVLPIVFLSGRGNIQSSVKAMKAGADDFLCKPASKQDLLGAIERAISKNQKAIINRGIFDDFRRRLETLTPREKQVYALVVAGKLNKQIAYELNTTERTIKAHRQKVMHKLNVRSIVELVSLFERASAAQDSEKPLLYEGTVDQAEPGPMLGGAKPLAPRAVT